MHQKTPVFLLKCCHNKDLKKMNHRFSAKNSKSAFAEASTFAKATVDKSADKSET